MWIGSANNEIKGKEKLEEGQGEEIIYEYNARKLH